MIDSPVAEVRIHGQVGVLVCGSCSIDAGLVHVEGRWRRRIGLNNTEEQWSGPRAYSFPVAELRRIRWLRSEATA